MFLLDIGTYYLTVFVPLYILLSITMIIIHYLRVHIIEPVIDFHVNRRGIMVCINDVLSSLVLQVILRSKPFLGLLCFAGYSNWRNHYHNNFANRRATLGWCFTKEYDISSRLLSHIPPLSNFELRFSRTTRNWIIPRPFYECYSQLMVL